MATSVMKSIGGKSSVSGPADGIRSGGGAFGDNPYDVSQLNIDLKLS